MDAVNSPRQFLEQLYVSCIAALQPGGTVTHALDTIATKASLAGSLHVLAIGKAATAMTLATEAWCADRGVAIAGGLAVAQADTEPFSAGIRLLVGDHPTPGHSSQMAAAELGRYVDAHIHAGDRVLVLLSGGASAVIGAPRDGIDPTEFVACFAALLGAGLTIDEMNSVRRRLSRWGGGRLGAALLRRGARVVVLVVSDVIGDNLAAIGSGPCAPDWSGEAQIDTILVRAHVSTEMRDRIRANLAVAFAADASAARADVTTIPHHIISNNSRALDIITHLARETGAVAVTGAESLQGDADACGSMVARELLSLRAESSRRTQPVIVCWGGEPTVTLPEHDPPRGGRMQALALSAARSLHIAGDAAQGITILAAGTDGRDGTTDAAGAVVDDKTWRAISADGRDPARDLAGLRSHDALRLVRALLPAFVSGTNVNDVVIGMIDASVD